jgi:hypothetical protein
MDWPTRVRRLFKLLYVLICVAGVAIVAYSATYGAYFQDEDAVEAPAATAHLAKLDGQKCIERFKSLHAALKKQAHATMDAPSSASAGESWRTWARKWRGQVKQASSACGLKRDKSMKPLLEVAKDLKRLEVAYAAAITGFRQAGHAPHLRLEAAFERLVSSPAL